MEEAYKLTDSDIRLPESLALWDMPSSTLAIRGRTFVDYRPTSLIQDGCPIVFNIPSLDSSYRDLSKAILFVHLTLVNSEGAGNYEVPVALVNLPSHSLFRNVECQLNEKVVESGTAHHTYKALIECLLGTTETEKRTLLQNEGFYQDTPGQFDNVSGSTTEPVNEGFIQRWGLFNGMRRVELAGPLRLDVFQTTRCLISGLSLRLKFWPQSDAFLLMNGSDGQATFRVKVEDMFIRIPQVDLDPVILAAHEQALDINPARYPYMETRVKSFPVPQGAHSHSVDDVFDGDVPSCLVFGLVNSEAFEGHDKKNPYLFHHYDLDSVSVLINNYFQPYAPLRCEFGPAWSNSAQLYRNLFDVFKTSEGTVCNGISMKAFLQGTTLLAFRLAPEREELVTEREIPLFRRGQVKVQLSFASPLPENVALVCYGRFPRLLQITKQREILI